MISIKLELRGDGTSGGSKLVQLKVTGYDSAPTEPMPGAVLFTDRSEYSSFGALSTYWTDRMSFRPLKVGNHLSPTRIVGDGFHSTNPTSFTKTTDYRYKIKYADGASVTSETFTFTNEGGYAQLFDHAISYPSRSRGMVTSIVVQLKGNGNEGFGRYVAIKVTGFETAP